MLFTVLFTWGTTFSILAGMVAFLITYKEMSRHYVDKKAPARQALSTGSLTFLLFFTVTLLLAFGLPSLF